jgi:DNA-binding Lrp family transcriptional regulator
MNNDMDKRKSAIWEEIIKEAQEMNVPLQDGEMTSAMFAEQAGLGERWAREKLEKLVRKGVLKKRYATLGGHRTSIYFPAKV